MALGDFIGSLQSYPWRERMLMPEEESIEHVQGDGWKAERGDRAGAPANPEPGATKPHMGARRNVQRSGRGRKPHRNGSES